MLQLPKPLLLSGARAPQQERPPQREAGTPPQSIAPTRRNQREPERSNEDP